MECIAKNARVTKVTEGYKAYQKPCNPAFCGFLQAKTHFEIGKRPGYKIFFKKESPRNLPRYPPPYYTGRVPHHLNLVT